jgi:hypothetical protein
MRTKWLINPFERVAGWQALAIGVAVMALTAVIGQINQVAFDGVIDGHAGATFSLSMSFAMQAINFLSLFLMIWLAGVCFSKTKFRAIDVAGTISLARVPMLLLTVFFFLPIVPKSLNDIPCVFIFSLISIPLLIWMIALMYNAYTVSCHLKGTRAVTSFIGALIAAEIISKIAIFFLLSSSACFVSDNRSDNPRDNVVEMNSPQEQTINQQTAGIVIEAFKQSDIETVRSYFNETMKNGLSEKDLKNVWTGLTLMCGKFNYADVNVEAIRLEKHEQYLIPCTFKRGKMNLLLTFDSEGKIAGLFFKP